MAGPRPAPIPFGRYRLYERIAVGGMAELFVAATEDDRPCVIKRVLPHLAADPRFIAMFLDEAKVAAQLHHPAIVQIFDLGMQDGHLFIAMELLAGEDCAELIAAAKQQREPVPWRLACAIVLRAAEALHCAHEATGKGGAPLHVVHRDVSPSNLFVTCAGDVKLLDFGIARSAQQAEATATGEVKGKHGYMAPEQAHGLAVDRRADVWALGVCLYELLVGEPPRDAVPPSKLRAGLPDALDEVVLGAIASALELRTATARELAAGLEPFVSAGTRAELAAYLVRVFGPERLNAHLARARFGADPAPPRPRTLPLDEPGSGDPQMVVATIPLPSADLRVTTPLGSDPQMQVTTAPLAAPPPQAPQPPRRRRWKAPLAAGVLVAALVGLGLGRVALQRMAGDGAPAPPVAAAVTCCSAQIESTPADAALYLDGERLGPRTPAVIDPLPVGTYELRLAKDGFHSAKVRFDVGPQAPVAKLDVVLERDDEAVAFGMLEVRSTPPGAAVFLDGRRVAESTPAAIEQVLASDDHLLVLEKSGFELKVEHVAVEAGELKVVSATLRRELTVRKGERKRAPPQRDRLLPPPGRLTVESTVPVTASLDGVLLGQVPLTVEASAGAHALELRASGAPGRLVRVVVKSGQTTVHRAELRRTTLDVEASPQAEVFLDGEPLGHTPISGAPIWEGHHELQLVGPSGERSLALDAVPFEPLKVKQAL